MKVFLLFLCLFTLKASAQKELSKEAFQTKVRPALNGITNDFYQMISLFPNFPKEIVQVVDLMDGLHLDKENLLLGCPRLLNKDCLSSIENLRKQLMTINEKTLELTARLRLSESPFLNSMGGMRLLAEFQNGLHALQGSLSNTSFLIRAEIKDRKESYQTIKEMDQLKTLLSLAVVDFIPFNYRDDFRQFFFNFIHPLQLHISKNKNYEFLNRNVNSLNFALNLLVMNLTKRNKKTPDGMSPFLALIHNRWNSLLRYYM